MSEEFGFGTELMETPLELAEEIDSVLGNLSAGVPAGGSRGHVRWVQQSLNQLLGLNLAVDGIAGPQTRGAIRSFQQQQGLTVDGIVGPQTEGRMRQLLSAAPAAPGRIPCGPSVGDRSQCARIGQPEELSGFDQNSAELKPAHHNQLIKIAKCVLAKLIAREHVDPIRIVGHASDEGPPDLNLRLGQQRANKVEWWLNETFNRICPGSSRFVTILPPTSRGEAEAISGDRIRSRRVQVFVPLPIAPRRRRRRSPLPCVPPTRRRCSSSLVAPGSTAAAPADITSLIGFVRSILRRLPAAGLGATGIVVPSAARFLDAAEQREAMTMFGGSLDFTKILIVDGLGFQGRPFTVAGPFSTGFHVAMLLGDLCSWASKPCSSTLIHELAHAWQSQHHSTNPSAFMLNSVTCQALALADVPVAKAAAGASATQRAIRSGVRNPLVLARIAQAAAAAEDVSAYAYVPGRTFGEYAAEQIAQQVEDSYQGLRTPTPTVVTTIRSVTANAPSPDNEASLTVTSFHRRSTPGVVFP